MMSSEQFRILETAIEQSDRPVLLTTANLDPPGPEIVYVNQAVTRTTGYTREELIGATPRIFQGSATDREVLDRLKAELRAGNSFEGRTWNHRKDGTPYQVEWTVTPLRLEGKKVDYFFSLQRDVTDLYQSLEKLQAETRQMGALLKKAGADHDPITGVFNRRGMLLHLQRLIDEAENSNSVTGLVKLQFKRLDRVDQALGVEAINELLSDVGERLYNRLEPDEVLARSHEHTFAIVIPVAAEVTDKADHYLMERARALVEAVTEEAFNTEGNAFQVTVGAGFARAPTDGRDAQEIVAIADEAAQRASNADLNPVCWPDHTTIEVQRNRLTLEEDLQRAIAERKLAVFYQPIVDLGRNEVVGAEALVRWPQPDGHSPVGPDRFIPLAEELGLMDRLGTQVLEDACGQLQRWQQQPGNAAFWVSVNVAPAQLRDPNLAERFIGIARAMGVSPACVKLEITESALEQGLDEVSHVLDELVAAGFPLALDDFGTGHSSLGRLIDMPFSVLKVDRSFVWQTPDGRGAGVVASLSQLSRHLHLHALGEGVENAAHESFLHHCQYRYAQGFYYAKPMAAADFESWLGWSAG